MFTGIVEATGTVADVRSEEGGIRIRLETSLSTQLSLGASLAVNGVCLTVVSIDDGHVMADIGPETARITTLGSLQRGQAVNLERPMRLDGRLDGHFVLGHVDGVGTVADLRSEADSHWLSVRFPTSLAPLFIRKGSVAIDGISLTVADVSEAQLEVMIIPFTWSATNLQGRRVGDLVNLECDMIGKYVARALQARV